VHVFDVQRGGFVPAAQADNAGTGPYMPPPLDDDDATRL
jgi:carbonic anhydrase